MEQSMPPIGPKPFGQFDSEATEQLPPHLEDQLKASVVSIQPEIGLLLRSPANTVEPLSKLEALERSYRQILMVLGVDLNDPHFKATPLRAAKALLEMTTPVDFVMKSFPEKGADGLLFQNGIFISSLCPHHILPWFGTACIAFLPRNGRILGLSKFSRLARYHAAGLMTQEKVTSKIGETLLNHDELQPAGVGVSLRCYHTCMACRGVRDSGAVTTTQYLGGWCMTDPALRAEFMSVIRHPDIMQ